ncbi:MAG TPA: hypothetical protein VFS42_02460 [Burkholderiaceae bacterium]|nr:hypothetical protein [Burkholderiaceae bacterium]
MGGIAIGIPVDHVHPSGVPLYADPRGVMHRAADTAATAAAHPHPGFSPVTNDTPAKTTGQAADNARGASTPNVAQGAAQPQSGQPWDGLMRAYEDSINHVGRVATNLLGNGFFPGSNFNQAQGYGQPSQAHTPAPPQVPSFWSGLGSFSALAGSAVLFGGASALATGLMFGGGMMGGLGLAAVAFSPIMAGVGVFAGMSLLQNLMLGRTFNTYHQPQDGQGRNTPNASGDNFFTNGIQNVKNFFGRMWDGLAGDNNGSLPHPQHHNRQPSVARAHSNPPESPTSRASSVTSRTSSASITSSATSNSSSGATRTFSEPQQDLLN